MLSLSLVAIFLGFCGVAYSATFSIQDTFIGGDFLTGFEHEAIADPTHGRVNYVDQLTALADNLTFVSTDTLILRCDDTNILDPNGPGRNSVRIRSGNTYNHHVAVFDIRHMPEGCSTWPAAWETLEADWPNSGETDIVEGVNNAGPNLSSLHTSANCSMPDSDRSQSGFITTNDCVAADNSNTGCGVQTNKPNSFGPSFNNNGGGWFAMERTSDFIRIFFWPRDDNTVPTEVTGAASTIDTDNWGQPVALFPSTSSCDIDSHFGDNNIIINLTLCGDFAGQPSVFASDGCPGDCIDFVNNNPSAFENAFWDIASLRVYT